MYISGKNINMDIVSEKREIIGVFGFIKWIEVGGLGLRKDGAVEILGVGLS